MNSSMTIGQYFPGNSPVHRMDARMKIVLTFLMVVAVFLCKNFWSLGLAIVFMILAVGLSKIPPKTILKSIKPLIVIILITGVINLFYGDGEPLVTLGKLKITMDGIMTAVFMAVRIIELVIVGSLLTYTTSPTELTDALERLFKPLKVIKIDVHVIAMTMTIALRFIPTLIEEIDKIMAAQKSRGADMESGGLIRRAKGLVPILIPLFISSFRRANELADAMECRCYRGGAGRTKMKEMHLHTGDFFALAAVVLYNLISVNLAERKKELATIKVLGFYDKEVYRYIFREIELLSLIGSGVGLLLGVPLHRFIILTVEMDQLMFIRTIAPHSYLLAVALTMLFTFVVCFAMRRHVRHISMVESMKAPE